MSKLNAAKPRTLTKPGAYGDGGGLYSQVRSPGNRSWLYRFKANGKAHPMGLGTLSDVSLAEARETAQAARKLGRQGIDPIDRRRAERAEAAARVGLNTFFEVADASNAAHEASWRNAKHRRQWRNTVDTYAAPILGKMPVAQVDVGAVMRVLEPIWREKTVRRGYRAGRSTSGRGDRAHRPGPRRTARARHPSASYPNLAAERGPWHPIRRCRNTPEPPAIRAVRKRRPAPTAGCRRFGRPCRPAGKAPPAWACSPCRPPSLTRKVRVRWELIESLAPARPVPRHGPPSRTMTGDSGATSGAIISQQALSHCQVPKSPDFRTIGTKSRGLVEIDGLRGCDVRGFPDPGLVGRAASPGCVPTFICLSPVCLLRENRPLTICLDRLWVGEILDVSPRAMDCPLSMFAAVCKMVDDTSTSGDGWEVRMLSMALVSSCFLFQQPWDVNP